ncbi:MAG: hypothetical protein M5U34_36100 [Chloroflexi bacterium]|nr:hypothetical protein [Chloroflexota bacterium]
MAAAGLNFKDVMLALGMFAPPLPDGTVPFGFRRRWSGNAAGPQVSRVQGKMRCWSLVSQLTG